MTKPAVCQDCGAEPRPSARFCDACGSPLTAAVDTAEYKQVTVLFADVVRSMDMVAALGAERMRELMTELVARTASVVRRYEGTVNQFTGDGIMALFGAPKTLEDHARRACLAALDIQTEARALAAEVERSDKISLQLRVGLNSGMVVAGGIGSGPIAYTAIGEHVGMAQRMESVATPGGVMLSQSTARLVENEFLLGETELVRIKGAEDGVPARRLESAAMDRRVSRRESRLVGRESETAEVQAALDAASSGSGAIVTVAGPPGIGKTRLVREAVTAATTRGFAVFSTYCESHTRDIGFNVIIRLLRSMFGLRGLSIDAARERVRDKLSHAAIGDLLLLDDLLGIRDSRDPLPDITPDARRRRLVNLIDTAARTWSTGIVFVVEDVHWIDSVSEAMLDEIAFSIPSMRAAMLITYRPEYVGTFVGRRGVHPISLEPLADSHSAELMAELLGTHPSVLRLRTVVAERAAGIPFFAEEIVRDLAEQGVLKGSHGAYACVREVGDVHVPATLQATIGARIDRLPGDAKRALHSAAVIGARFDAALLRELSGDAPIEPLLDAELVDRLATTTGSAYTFRHPLIQKVAYESQLKSDRADLHRRLAGAIERSTLGNVDENAALIATQWEAAGDFRAASDWHMRAGSWFNYRDHRAARTSWDRARHAADKMPADSTDRLTMQIAPRTLICATTFRVGGNPADTGFDELKELTTLAGDKASLAIGMAGYLTTLAFRSHHREASRLASEFVTLVESIGDPAMTAGLLPAAAQAKYEAGEMSECLLFADRAIDAADGDPTLGSFLVACPLAWAISLRGAAKMFLGLPGWRADFDEGLAMAMPFDIQSRCNMALYRYALAIQNGAELPDATGLAYTAEWLEDAESTGDPTAIALVSLVRGVMLANSAIGDRASGIACLAAVYDQLSWLTAGLRRIADVEIIRYTASAGDLDRAIARAQEILDEAFDTGEMFTRGASTTVLVETLLRRNAKGDLTSAQAAINRLAAVPAEPTLTIHEMPLLRSKALVARANGDEEAYARLVSGYRDLAERLGFEGHKLQARAM